MILEADVFIGEMDLSMLATQVEIPQYDIHHYLKDEIYQKIRHQLIKSFKLNLDQFAHMHPLMIMSAISNSVLQTQHQISLDEHLWKYATENGKVTAGLESFEEQFEILHSIDAGPLYKQLRNIGRNPSGVRKHTARGLNLYLQGRIHELYMLSKSSMHHLRKKIIYERNAGMANVIIQLDISLRYFITVGAGHLSGKTGIISLLRKEGYKVTPGKDFSTLKK